MLPLVKRSRKDSLSHLSVSEPASRKAPPLVLLHSDSGIKADLVVNGEGPIAAVLDRDLHISSLLEWLLCMFRPDRALLWVSLSVEGRSWHFGSLAQFHLDDHSYSRIDALYHCDPVWAVAVWLPATGSLALPLTRHRVHAVARQQGVQLSRHMMIMVQDRVICLEDVQSGPHPPSFPPPSHLLALPSDTSVSSCSLRLTLHIDGEVFDAVAESAENLSQVIDRHAPWPGSGCWTCQTRTLRLHTSLAAQQISDGSVIEFSPSTRPSRVTNPSRPAGYLSLTFIIGSKRYSRRVSKSSSLQRIIQMHFGHLGEGHWITTGPRVDLSLTPSQLSLRSEQLLIFVREHV